VLGGTPQNVDLVVADGRIVRAGGKFTSISIKIASWQS
jgi:hypothetical protein